MSSNDDTIIDLNFVPDWAREPAGLNVYIDSDQRTQKKTRRLSKDEIVRKNGRQHWKAPSREHQYSTKPDGQNERSPQRRPSVSRPVSSAYDHHHTELSQFPVRVAFIPERSGVKPIVKWLARTRRAYSLMDVASMFLSKPAFFAVKLEIATPEEDSPSMLLYQCSECKAVSLKKEKAVAHALNSHFSKFYEKEEVQVDPPKGKFMSVTRCGLSRELLGPPNYHGYNDKVHEAHRTRFSNLSLEEYRKHLVNETDQALIEQWKQEATRQVHYRTRETNDPQIFKRRSDLDAHFIEHHAPSIIREGRRFIIPGTVSRVLESECLSQAIHDSWNKERRFPLKMSIAVHPAFRHLGLFIFKTPDRIAFVTAIQPNSIDPSQTTDIIRSILEYLDQYPGSNRQELVENLRPSAMPDSPEIAEIVNQLRWLIDKGHVIEFFNGKLAVPHRKATHSKLRHEPKKRIPHHAPSTS